MSKATRLAIFVCSLALLPYGNLFGQVSQCQGGPLDGLSCALDQDCFACDGGQFLGSNCVGANDCEGSCDIDGGTCLDTPDCLDNFCIDAGSCDFATCDTGNSCDPGICDMDRLTCENDGSPCNTDDDCSTCAGGFFDGISCTVDDECFACDSGQNIGGTCTDDLDCASCDSGINAGFSCGDALDCPGSCELDGLDCDLDGDCNSQTCFDVGTCDMSGGCIQLPVELVSFEAIVESGIVELRWKTASEVNNAGFSVEVQRSALGTKNWVELAFVEGAGTTDTPQSYSFQARDMEPGTWNFRLKQTDIDGTFVYSQTVELDVILPMEYVLEHAYPNPFNPSTTLRFAVAAEQHVRVVLVDMLGREVKTLYDDVPEVNAMTHVTISGSGLSTGTYLVSLQGERFVATRDVILVK